MRTAIVVSVVLFSRCVSLADVSASAHLGGGTLGTFLNPTGFAFVPGSDLTVTRLGIWDAGGDGLTRSHNVGLFVSASRAALSIASVPAGDGAALIDGSRFVEIAPVQLLAGTSYYILADGFFDEPYVYGNDAVAYASDIAWLAAVNGQTQSIFSTPIFLNDGVRGDLGPNFQFIPAPGALAVAFALLWARRRR